MSEDDRLSEMHRQARLLAVVAYNLESNPPAYVRLRVERVARLRRKAIKSLSLDFSTEKGSTVYPAPEKLTKEGQ